MKKGFLMVFILPLVLLSFSLAFGAKDKDTVVIVQASQAIAAAAGGLAAAGAWSDSISWWLLLISVVLTWVSGLDYARSAPSVLRGRAVAPL